MRACHAGSPGPRQRGLTLLEVALYVAILSTLTVPIVMINVSMGRMASEGNMISLILERNRVGLQRLEDDFRNSISGSSVVSNGGKTLRFTHHGGFDGTSTRSGNVLRYEVRPNPQDPVNGIDDNQNGIVDESILVRVNETANETITLASGLDSSACSFTASGTGVLVTLSTIGWASTSKLSTRMSRTLVLTPMN